MHHMMMMGGGAPTYCNNVEIITFCTKAKDHMVLLRFYFGEPTERPPEGKRPMMMNPGPSIIMPRPVAKQVMKKFSYFMARQDEGGIQNE